MKTLNQNLKYKSKIRTRPILPSGVVSSVSRAGFYCCIMLRCVLFGSVEFGCVSLVMLSSVTLCFVLFSYVSWVTLSYVRFSYIMSVKFR